MRPFNWKSFKSVLFLFKSVIRHLKPTYTPNFLLNQSHRSALKGSTEFQGNSLLFLEKTKIAVSCILE